MHDQIPLSSGHFHIDTDTLELFALGRITNERELAPIEEHLFVCTICQDRLSANDAFIVALRTAFERLGWMCVHQTEDGELRMFVYEGSDGKYIGRIIGAGVDGGTWQTSSMDAQTWCVQAFAEMFPEHRCDAGCSQLDVR